MKLAALNAHADAARLRVDALEAELAAAYLAALRAAGRKAAARFRGAVTVKAITAATNPWVPPDPDELLDAEALAAATQKKTQPVKERALRLAVPVGISFDLSNPLATAFLDGIATRSARILDGFTNEIGAAIGQAYDEGLSVPKAAQLLRSRVESASEIQATLLARSDLVSIANGGSLLAAQIVNQASVDAGETGVPFKTWKTAEDDRVRPDHADADGQTVPIGQPFDVGGEQLQYPGDPAGSDENVLNCRCTLLYGDEALTAAAGPEVSTLAMIAVHPTTDEASTLAVDGGLPPDELHVTLLFLGDAAALDAQAVKDAVAAVAKTLPPIDGSVGGAAHFAEGPDGYPSILLPDVKGLSTLQETLRASLAEASIESPSEHGFLPHMTLTYAEAPEVPDVEALGSPLHFDNVSVVIGGERTDYPLTGALTSGGTMDASPEVTTAPLVLRDFHLTAAAGEPTKWHGTLLVEDEPTEDGRMIAAGATTWRSLPLPLMAQIVTDDGHDGAELCGRIDQIWRAAGGVIQATGIFDDVASPFAASIVQKVRDQMLNGVSVDPVGGESEIIVTRRQPDVDEEQELVDEVEQVQGDPSYEEPSIGPDDVVDILQVYTELILGGATICPFQAVARARIDLVAGATTDVLPLMLPFEATWSEEITANAEPSTPSTGTFESLVSAAVARTVRAELARFQAEHREQLQALSASAATEREMLKQELATMTESVLRGVKDLGAAVVSVKRELGDRLGSVEAQQTANLTASGATTEGLEEITRRLESLDTIAGDLDRLRELVERKPRQVEFRRDDKGRLAGLVEG